MPKMTIIVALNPAALPVPTHTEIYLCTLVLQVFSLAEMNQLTE